MSTPTRRWDIVETRAVVKRKSPATGAKAVNNYELGRTLGQGRFAKVKLGARVTDAAPPSTTTASSSRSSSGSSSSSSNSARRREFAIKIFSKKKLLKMKEYVSVAPAAAPPTTTTTVDTSGDCGGGGTANAAEAAEAHHPPPPPSSSASSSSSSAGMRVVTALDRVRAEVEVMRTLYHRNIVLLFEVIEAEASDKIYLVLEHMPGGPCMVFRPDTKDFASPLTQSVLPDALARSHVRDILEGLAYLRERGICHRDLKPDNILLNASGRCHLCDFGCALVSPTTTDARGRRVPRPTRVTDTVGTYQFLAPECCSGEPYDPFKVDVWAVGVLLFIFLFGRLPFEADGAKELFEEISRGSIQLPPARILRDDCRDLLTRLLTKDPDARISLDEALEHPWLRDEQDENDEEDQPPSF